MDPAIFIKIVYFPYFTALSSDFKYLWFYLVYMMLSIRDVEAAGSNPVTPIIMKQLLHKLWGSCFCMSAMYMRKWSSGSCLSNGIIYLLIEMITFIIRSGASISRQAVALHLWRVMPSNQKKGGIANGYIWWINTIRNIDCCYC